MTRASAPGVRARFGGAALREWLLRFGEIDVVEAWRRRLPPLLVELLFGLSCTVGMIAVRLAIDVVAPTAGPFSLIYPAVLISTLFGRWRAGLTTFVTAFLFAWYFVLPDPHSFRFAVAGDAARTVVNACSALVILLFAEVFRGAVRRAASQRDAEIALRDLLLREIDHRMKNNFMIVGSLLELQRRRQPSEEAREALAAAAARIHSFTAAHQALYEDGGRLHDVAMGEYLRTLTRNIVDALFLPERIELRLDADDIMLPRDKAVSIGLVLNEAVTNAAKHAFGPDERGAITVAFHAEGADWRLCVADDGRGGAPPPATSTGLGSSLIVAFAERAGAQVVTERLDRGTRVVLSGRREASS
ncbi:sensor histidine kinase [Phenylobacterium sp.]|uniref:sensor histidine kinase n=1 Tax=Phenylobacterium sp. TaxID=1871053 RepID=UPI0035C825BB